MKKCKKCGNEIDEAIKFCPNCGKKQKKLIKRRWLKVLIIILTVLIVAYGAAFVGVRIVDRPSESEYDRVYRQLGEEEQAFLKEGAPTFHFIYGGNIEDIIVLSVWKEGENYRAAFRKGTETNLLTGDFKEPGKHGWTIIDDWFENTGQQIPESELDAQGITAAIRVYEKDYVLPEKDYVLPEKDYVLPSS